MGGIASTEQIWRFVRHCQHGLSMNMVPQVDCVCMSVCGCGSVCECCFTLKSVHDIVHGINVINAYDDSIGTFNNSTSNDNRLVHMYVCMHVYMYVSVCVLDFVLDNNLSSYCFLWQFRRFVITLFNCKRAKHLACIALGVLFF